MLLSLTAIAPMMLMQVGPHPGFGTITDHSAEVQDRPPRSQAPAPSDPAGVLQIADNGWLKNCLELVETSPARAHVQAQLRRDQTTASDQVLANYCLGMASAGLERWEDASTALIAARDGTGPQEQRMKARFGAMAGNAALAQGEVERGLELLSRAQFDAEAAGFGPLAAVTAIDRAFALVDRGDNTQALAALAEARRLDPAASEAWLLSATLLRRMDRLEEAQQLIEQAAGLAPTSPDIALEAGVIAVLSGRDDAARSSWNSAIALAPDSPQAQTARGYLAQLGDAVPTP